MEIDAERSRFPLFRDQDLVQYDIYKDSNCIWTTNNEIITSIFL